MEKIYNKLVRDNIPEIIKSNNGPPYVRKLTEEEFWEYLLKKDNEELEEVKNSTTKEDYKKINGSYYDNVRNTGIEDFKIGGSKRFELCVSIPLVQAIAENSNNESFKKELNEYLELIEYDKTKIFKELKRKKLSI